MRSLWRRCGAPVALAGMATLAFAAGLPARAQRHSLGSAPPTAPVPKPGPPAGAAPAVAQIAPVSSGMGAIQFFTASAIVPAPQALTRQLGSDDERTRSGALSSIGAPGQYLGKGHVPYAHSVQLDLVQLGEGDQLDALLTVELDQHIVTAVMVPDGDNWRRVATVLFATAFSNAATSPATFVRALRSWLQPDRYRAVFHATVTDPAGGFTENEADLNIVNNRPVIVLDFVSGARHCDPTGQLRPPHQSCELIQRWLEPDPSSPTHHFTLITGTGHFSAPEAKDPLSRSRNFRLTHLRAFTCQPFLFSEPAMRFEPTANPTVCAVHEPPHPEHPEATKPEHTEPPKPDHTEAPKPVHPDGSQHP